jgi:hypothetical protein
LRALHEGIRIKIYYFLLKNLFFPAVKFGIFGHLKPVSYLDPDPLNPIIFRREIVDIARVYKL